MDIGGRTQNEIVFLGGKHHKQRSGGRKEPGMFGDRGSTILLTNRLEGNLRTGIMFLEHFAQNSEAHPRFSKQAVSHCNGGWEMSIQKAQ